MIIEIKEVGDRAGHVDIFWGTGWHNWSRCQITNVPGQRPVFEHKGGFGLPWNVRNVAVRQLRLG